MHKTKKETSPGFKVETSGARGFWMTFANGYKVSVQYGYGNYSDNRDFQVWKDGVPDFWESSSAEVAVLSPSDEFVDLRSCDQVVGWQSPEEVLRIMTWAANQGCPPTMQEK